MGGRSAAVVVPSCGENVAPQEVDRDSLQGDGVGADRDLAHQSGGHERKWSHLGWAR